MASPQELDWIKPDLGDGHQFIGIFWMNSFGLDSHETDVFFKKRGDENGNYWEHDENPIKKRGTLFSDRPILDSSQKKTKTMAKVSFRS